MRGLSLDVDRFSNFWTWEFSLLGSVSVSVSLSEISDRPGSVSESPELSGKFVTSEVRALPSRILLVNRL